MAVHCRPCAKGDHADCTRWLMRDHPCTCVCDDAPRQLSLLSGIEEGSPPALSATFKAGGGNRRRK